MVLKFTLFAFLLGGGSLYGQSESVRKLKVFRSKIVKGLKENPYYIPRVSYKKFVKVAKKLKQKKSLQGSTLDAFLSLAKIDTYLFLKTKKNAYKVEAAKALYVPHIFSYKKSEVRSLSRKISKISGKQKVVKSRLKSKKQRKKAKKKRRKLTKTMSVYSSFVSWQEDRTGSSSGDQFLLYAQMRGLCSGASYDFIFNNLVFRAHGCAIFPGKVDIKSVQDGVYEEEGVSSLGLMSGIGINYMALPDRLNFIFSTEFLMRKTDWGEPSGFEIDSATMLTLGFSAGAEMVRGNYSFEVKAGYGMAFSSIYWSLGFHYYLF